MEWSREKIIDLIKEYKKCECLWNADLKDYKNILKKKDAWHDIGRNLEINAADAEQKMKSILAAYRREKKKVTDAKISGSGAEEMYEPKWFAYQHMKFMHNINRPRATRESLNHTDDSCRNVSDISESNNEENGEGSQPKANSNYMHNRVKECGRREKEPDGKRFKLSDKVEIAKDDCATFGEMVAHKLRKLPSDYDRLLAQRKIDDILHNMLIGVLRKQRGVISPKPSFASENSSD